MHQENLVGNPADLDALIKDRPPTEFEKHMHDLEVRRLEDLAQRRSLDIESELKERTSHRPPPNLVLESKTECCCKTTTGTSRSDILGQHAWSLKCLLQDIRSVSQSFGGEQRANATLAVRHLEDALHRIKLALEQ
jgi:hypothetical protein